MPLPSTERILLGPGPSLISPRVMRAMAAPVLSHLDPDFVPLLDDVRGAAAAACSGPTTSRSRSPRPAPAPRPWKPPSPTRCPTARAAVVVVTGYFGDRLAQMFERYGARVCARLDVEWGRAVRSRDGCATSCSDRAPTSSALVHAETSTGVLQPGARAGGGRARARRADHRGRRDLARRACRSTWRRGASTSPTRCSQKCIGAPSGMSPIAVSGAARARAGPVPQLLPRPEAARGLLGAPQVSPHAVDAR